MEETITELWSTDKQGNPEEFIVGKNGVEKIEEHKPYTENDKWFWTVETKTEYITIFNLERIVITKGEQG